MDEKRVLMQHFLATLAYRTQKAVRDAPPGYSDFRAAPGVRTPCEIVKHMSGVLSYARSYFVTGDTRIHPLESLDAELERFHAILRDLGRHLAAETPRKGATAERLLQGPLSDAMTHAGQLAMLRRLAGSPVPPENFLNARIRSGNLGPTQPDPASPDSDWVDAEGNRQM